MKKSITFLGMLLSLGLFSACSSDDGISDIMDKKLSLFEDSLLSVPEDDYTGYMHYDNRCGWHIVYSQPIDHVDTYFPLNLPDQFKEEWIKVSFSGKVVEMTNEEFESLHFAHLGGYHYYFVYLTKIEIMEEEEIPYRGNPPFTITDMPGVVGRHLETKAWLINYSMSSRKVNVYFPMEINDDFKVPGLKVIISGNVYEDVSDPQSGNLQKKYKIELTKIEKAK